MRQSKAKEVFKRWTIGKCIDCKKSLKRFNQNHIRCKSCAYIIALKRSKIGEKRKIDIALKQRDKEWEEKIEKHKRIIRNNLKQKKKHWNI